MSKLQELIRELCPEGVEYKTLEEVCNILDYQRKPVSKSKRKFGIYPYYGANGIQDYVDDYLFDGTFVLVGEDGSVINKDNSPVINWADGKIWVNNHAHILSERSEIMLLRFLYFALSVIDVSAIVRGTPPKLNQANLRNIKIPTPPLSVQEEIVRILDHFTNLAAELQAELQARKEQYEYYRDKLLNFSGVNEKTSVTWMKMSEICDIKRGVRVTRNSLVSDGSFSVFQNSLTPLGKFDKYNRDSDKTFVICAGAAGEIGYSNKPFWAADDCFTIETDMIDNKYIYHFLLTKKTFLKSRVRKASVPRISSSEIGKLVIPIPSLAEQQRIVSILDKFEALVNDLTEGLPAEIAAVQEQYEYYRNKLLSFPRTKISA